MAERFWKYQGLGNDFIVLDRLAGGQPLTAEHVVALCDRHRGIGADGVLSVWSHEGAAARMQVQNADGTAAGMCGNGLRCVVRFLFDEGHVAADELAVAVGDQPYECIRRSDHRVAVHMGKARQDDVNLPPPTRGADEIELEVEGRTFTGTRLSMGNPHLVIFVEDGIDPMDHARRFGPALESHPAFVDRVNVSFVSAHAGPPSGRFVAVVHERGVGITQACGSGACAVAAAAVRRGRWPAAQPVRVQLPGGELTITVGADGAILMEGEAVRVFSGELPPATWVDAS